MINKKKERKEKGKVREILIRIIIYGFGIAGWLQMFILISGALFFSNGIIIINFNHFQEILFEFIMFLSILVSMLFFSIYDLKNIFKKVIYE
jgi:hypothetical protein